jgi:hypothetical protein
MDILLNPAVLIVVVITLFIVYLKKAGESPKMVHGNFIRTYLFPESLKHKLIEHYPHLNQDQADEIIEGLRTYFQICNLTRNESEEIAMPSRAVDSAWHEFILHTELYAQFCEQAFGRFLHHRPAEGMESQTEAQLAMTYTYEQACIMFTISVKHPAKLPPLFALDARLRIPQGFIYSLDCLAKNDGKFCLSHIGSPAQYKKELARSKK